MLAPNADDATLLEDHTTTQPSLALTSTIDLLTLCYMPDDVNLQLAEERD